MQRSTQEVKVNKHRALRRLKLVNHSYRDRIIPSSSRHHIRFKNQKLGISHLKHCRRIQHLAILKCCIYNSLRSSIFLIIYKRIDHGSLPYMEFFPRRWFRPSTN